MPRDDLFPPHRKVDTSFWKAALRPRRVLKSAGEPPKYRAALSPRERAENPQHYAADLLPPRRLQHGNCGKG